MKIKNMFPAPCFAALLSVLEGSWLLRIDGSGRRFLEVMPEQKWKMKMQWKSWRWDQRNLWSYGTERTKQMGTLKGGLSSWGTRLNAVVRFQVGITWEGLKRRNRPGMRLSLQGPFAVEAWIPGRESPHSLPGWFLLHQRWKVGGAQSGCSLPAGAAS